MLEKKSQCMRLTYQICNVGYLYGVMNHIFSEGIGSFVKHGLVEDQGDLDELLGRSNITLDFSVFCFFLDLCILFDLRRGRRRGHLQERICFKIACTAFAPFIAARIVVIASDCTALWSVVLILVQDMRMFGLQ